ncbi:HD domain-containing protein [Streptomyces cocklensis]|jgi:HD superfamily phosphodiesterase|uniref:Cyanamide hydratase n=1 Tax=Actinacidiphila cocklensis TaxID=887465 RepID=A0A9W4GW72_9ACTN|nr:HD domain-containing protein [Actinacidiphila cocklensis]MDD1058851.1 HD domain-containing protein [Actinacidiphila cocklensis]WSX74950.1 HD domain-containing protein [Streptomyces sp. NBC_00899]CAG6398981.1 Cyanamide hydratase [Actinacidiphila cocklensis]
MQAITVPDSATSAAALEVVTAYQSPAMVNHSLRAYLWAAARGAADGIPFDPELLYVAALFHDMGLVPAFDSHTVAFEEAGGHVAQVFAAGAGWGAQRRGRLAEVIVRHMWPQVDAAADPEGHLLSRATATEITGKDADDYPADFRAEVLERYPRLDLGERFLACFEAQAARKPTSSAATAMRSGLAARMAGNPLDAPA